MVFAALAALAGVASFVAALACLIILVTGWRPGAPVVATLGRAARGDRTSPPSAGDEESEAVAAADLSAQIEARQEVLRKRREAIAEQVNAGWPLDIAEGRAAMMLAGMDADDVEQVVAFNNRHGMM